MNQLYFIALIPPDPLREKIHQLKLEVKEKFRSSHSLNAPPHITLLSPFRMDEDQESQLDSLLEVFAQSFDPFEIKFNDFSTFPSRVIFIDVEKSPKLMEVQEKLEELARSNPELFRYKYDERAYHPHLTLAFKDLSKKKFYKAWEEFQDREFNENFSAGHIHLLKHNGKRWEMINAFQLNGFRPCRPALF